MPDQFLQTREWALFQESLGRKIYLLPQDESIDPLVVIQLPLVGPFSYLYCPRGPVYAASENFEKKLASLIQLGKTIGAVFVRIEPSALTKAPAQFPCTNDKLRFSLKKAHPIQPKDVVLLDTSKNEENLFSEMSSKCRYNIRLAAKKGVGVTRIKTKEECTDEVKEEFLELLRATSSRNAFHLHENSYYRALLDYFLPETTLQPTPQKPWVRLYRAVYEGKTIAAAMILYFGNTANYIHGASLHEYRQVMAPYAMHMAAILDTQKLGYRLYDFGGIAASDDATDPWAGITRFKKGFGGTVFSYAGTFDMVLSPLRYNVYKIGRSLVRRR